MDELNEKTDFLLVEDDIKAAQLTVRVFTTQQIKNDIYWIKDSKEAVDFLFSKSGHPSYSQKDQSKLIFSNSDLTLTVNFQQFLKLTKNLGYCWIPIDQSVN